MIILFIVLVLYTISMLYPLLWGALTSLKSIDEFRSNKLGFPQDWAFSNFATVMQNFIVDGVRDGRTFEQNVWQMIVNTLLYVIGSAFVATFIPCIVAYVTAKFRYKMSKVIYAVVLITMMIPIVGSYPAEIDMLRKLNLYNTMYGAWLQKANFLGMYFLVFHATFIRLSDDFSEAAKIDGASEWTVMVRIIFPLVKNVFFTIFLIKFIEFWNDYQTPLLYIPAYPTLSYGLHQLTNKSINGLSYVPMRMAGCIIVIIPILILFLIFQERLMSNVSMGGLKE